MTQSVEVLLDERAESALTAQWLALHAAGLPSEHRSDGAGSHRPHVTLFAGAVVPDPETELSSLVEPLIGLPVVVGSVLLFGPRRDRVVVVRQVLPSADVLVGQGRVASWCGALRGGQFGPGRWAPHLTPPDGRGPRTCPPWCRCCPRSPWTPP